MEWENSLIVSASGRIVHMGARMLDYIELDKEHPAAYPAGCIQRGDLVLYVKWKGKAAFTAEGGLSPFEKIGIRPSSDQGSMLFLGAFDNPEVQPVEKYGEGLYAAEQPVLLDTYFSGKDIKVLWSAADSQLTAQMNGQMVSCTLLEGQEQLLIMGERGLRYFRDNGQESGWDPVEDILQGSPWHSYLDRNRLAGMAIKVFFSKELLAAFWRLEEGQTAVEIHGGAPLSLRYNRWQILGLECHQYTVVTQQDILQYMDVESQLYQRLEQLQEERRRDEKMPTTFRLWGNDNGLSGVRFLLQKACGTNVTVLLTGESGTGKTFLAREIHRNSKRYDREFIHVNCAAIPYQLIESELFGYEEGAFTGAKKGGRKGYFELADGGTIFLDEIPELPLPLQGKLLEVIQNRTFYRVGGSEKISINVRLIAATNRDLKEAVAAREFREDLYYRINVFPIELPPLRQRKGAILSIVADILPGICGKVELEPLMISPQALEKMKEYHWPGNIRELENLLEKAAILCDGKVILPGDIVLPESGPVGDAAMTLKDQRERCEKQAVLAALALFNGDKGLAARYLDVGRTSLFEKIKKYGIHDRWIGGQDDFE